MSGSLEATIANTLTLQDIQLAEAMSRLKESPSEFRAWITAQQARVKDDITRQKEESFNKVYGDFERSSKVEESILMHNIRAKELANIVQQVYDNQEESAQAVVQDKDLAGRKKEMNEWTVGNKQDTLFVFSSLFLLLSGLLLITGLWRMGIISSALWVAMGVPMLIIFLLIFVRRWRYTEVLRNKRYWNKQIFEGKGKRVMMPSCEQLSQGIQSTANRLAGGGEAAMASAGAVAASIGAVGANMGIGGPGGPGAP